MACSTLLVLAALAAAGPTPQDAPPVRYRVQYLQTMVGTSEGQHEQAVAINAHGATVGQITIAGRAWAAHWKPSGDLSLLYAGEPKGSSLAFDLTDDGLAVGYAVARQETTPFQWSASGGNVLLDLGDGAVPMAVNDAHSVAYAYRSGDGMASAVRDASQATLVIDGAGQDVLVRDLNAAGKATGLIGGGGTPALPFRWTPVGGTEMLALPGGFVHGHGNALDAEGVVVGLSRNDERDQATLWDIAGAPTLLPYLRPSSTQSTAFAINSQGWVVGTEYRNAETPDAGTAVIWIDGKPWDLNFLALLGGAEPNLRITAALDINDQGQIAARGTVKGKGRALRLDPW
jgi:uncharacterized membrane protein